MKTTLVIILAVLVLFSSFVTGCDYITGKLPEFNDDGYGLHVDAYISSIHDWDNLPPASQVTSLTLYYYKKHNSTYDLSPLTQFVSLRSFSLTTRITEGFDLSPLSSLVNLTSLELNVDNKWADDLYIDLTILAPLKKLKSLTLDSYSLPDLSPLKELSKLTSLTINTNKLPTGFEQITSLNNLKSLHITVVKNIILVHLEAIGSLENLTDLYIDSYIFDFAYLSSLKNLVSLTLCSYIKENIDAISGFTNLVSLNLSNTQFKNISFLSSLTNLKELYLKDEQITDLAPIAALNTLTTLYLQNCAIEDISALKELTYLKNLSLVNNQIKDLSPLAGLTHLETLYLNNNFVEDIFPLSSLTNLQVLWLKQNKISDISPLVSLSNLTEVLLIGNPLNDYSQDNVIPILVKNNLTIYFYGAKYFTPIIDAILTSHCTSDYYLIVVPEMGLYYLGFCTAAVTSSGVDFDYAILDLKNMGYDFSTLVDIFWEQEDDLVTLEILSSLENGYIIDYDYKYQNYFNNNDHDGWEKLREENPRAGSFVRISVPIYNPKTGLGIVYFGSQGSWLSGYGEIIFFTFRNGQYNEIYDMGIWIS